MTELLFCGLLIALGVLIGFPSGRTWERNSHALSFPPVTDAPPNHGLAPPLTVAVARQVKGEIVIALIPFERPPSTMQRQR